MAAKRAFDVVVSAALLVATAPVTAAAVIAQRAGGGPVLWRSPRAGRDGRVFEMVTFRTMRDVPGAPVADRLTPVGRVLRDYSLDHLPTLVNVLRGDMSLVGPRPTEPDRVDPADPDWRLVLSVRPGLVSAAVLRLARTYNGTGPAERLRLEAAYVRRAGLRTDLALLARAAAAVVRSRGNVKARGRPVSGGGGA